LAPFAKGGRGADHGDRLGFEDVIESCGQWFLHQDFASFELVGFIRPLAGKSRSWAKDRNV
jgi:hypothetical protein